MSLLLRDLQAFYLEHERCGELDGGVEGELVRMAWHFQQLYRND
jgi:hypothetical protein